MKLNVKWPWSKKGSALDEMLSLIRFGSQSSSGARVNASSAMQLSAVFSCVRVISESVASLPIELYQRNNDGGKQRAPGHPLYKLLKTSPNGWQTSLEFIEMMQAHVELRGNAYAYISRLGGNVEELIPLHPDRIEMLVAPDLTITYKYTQPDGRIKTLSQSDVFHLRGMSSDGFRGLSMLSVAREPIGMGLSMQEHGARLFANGARPGLVLKHPGKLSKEAHENLRNSWNDNYGGAANSGKTALIEEGMSVEKIGMTNDDAQWLESRKLTRSEICGMFRVPPHKIGDLDRATFSNIEHQSIEFVTDAVLPRVRRWEQAIARDLILVPDKYFAEFNIAGLLRGDIKSRYESYAIARQWGWLSVNDIRRMENLNPVDNGDTYLQPLNMQPAGAPITPPNP